MIVQKNDDAWTYNIINTVNCDTCKSDIGKYCIDAHFGTLEQGVHKTRLDKVEVSVDKINPAHYKSHPSGIEAITILKHHNYSIGAALKYLWRCGLKAGEDTRTELRKAIRYLEFEIERIDEEEKANEHKTTLE